ncbi:MAG: aminopeptidase N [Candidatus Endobugula sp.]|jgi:aminopeptidase N
MMLTTNDTQPTAIYLSDYEVPNFLIEKTDLIFSLEESTTTVTSTLLIKKNSDSKKAHCPLVLHGEDLVLQSIAIDGRELSEDEYQLDDESLTLTIADQCIITCVTVIKPEQNTALEGLYKSSGMYCTQCEAEGFRKITYYLDRPDVMSVFSTKIIADKTKYPLLLSNGNLVNQGELDNNRHWIQWYDPFKKPAYLFALVAGNLSLVEDSFTTHSGREITLRIYVEKKDLNKCDHAMQSLKHAMRWDEEVYGREYDLELFMIVAVDDFNMGAMENKGLNIFNTSCVLANPETTTDAGFQRVEGVVAHEYFHNWSGNRVTCRDWFQLSLKEGFTVFRDEEFSADMGSRAVKRVEDVAFLRTTQFAEDAGPMAHPVQPSSFIEISNFYTLTIYEKGAEIVRMLHTLLGEETFREGSDVYFQRHDGQAVTINEFVSAMEAVSQRDLTQFKYWYTQAGTPVITVTDDYDAQTQRYVLTVKQHCPDTPEAKGVDKHPLHFPLSMGLLVEGKNIPLIVENDHANNNETEEGSDVIPVTSRVLEVTQAEQQFVFLNVPGKPVPSLLRQFSAPMRLSVQRTREEYLQLLAYDEDTFCRWDAGQQLAVSIIDELIQAHQTQKIVAIDNTLLNGLRVVLEAYLLDDDMDKAMVALLLTLPSEAYLSEIASVVDTEAIHTARNLLAEHLAIGLYDLLLPCYQALNSEEPYIASAIAIAKRSLKNTALSYLLLAQGATESADNKSMDMVAICYQQFVTANNMTDSFAGLKTLVHHQASDESTRAYQEKALNAFYQKWQHESLVVNQWLSVQATIPHVTALKTVKELMQHESFSMSNPNKVRALIGAFTQNLIAFHQPSGEGYRFLTEQVIALNATNPQIAARIITPLTRWKKYDAARQVMMKTYLEEIKNTPNLSKDVYEVVSKSL